MNLSDLARFDLIYLATPYTKYEGGITLAYIHACKIAARLIRRGLKVYSPIAHTHPIAIHGSMDALDLSIWLPFDAAMMGKSDAILVAMMNGWDVSTGVRHEIETFERARKPVFFLSPDDLSIQSEASLTHPPSAASASKPTPAPDADAFNSGETKR